MNREEQCSTRSHGPGAPLGAQSEVAALSVVLVKHARDAFVDEEHVDRQWRELSYAEAPNVGRAIEEYDQLVTLLVDAGVDVRFLPKDERISLDSLYTRDASISSANGMILCNMGKAARRAEPAATEAEFRRTGVPVLGTITGEGRIEGGDVVWIDDRTLAVGRGYRTNDEGIEQVRTLLGDSIDELIVVPLPHWRGPSDVFHLMSIISPIDHNLALVYSPLLPVPFREALLARGIELVEVPQREFETMGCNVLAIAPSTCIMLAGNTETRSRLEAAGVHVHELIGKEICAKGAGGPTCLTRPILRDSARSR